MKTSKMFRFQIRVNDALDYLADSFASSLDLTENIISGWIREDMIEELKSHFHGLNIVLLEDYK